MSHRYALASRTVCSPVARALARKATGRAANDNGEANAPAGDDVLRAALRHFGAHGLRAAEVARKHAESAFFAGDRQSYDWWLGICRTLDRRLATRTATSLSVH